METRYSVVGIILQGPGKRLKVVTTREQGTNKRKRKTKKYRQDKTSAVGMEPKGSKSGMGPFPNGAPRTQLCIEHAGETIQINNPPTI